MHYHAENSRRVAISPCRFAPSVLKLCIARFGQVHLLSGQSTKCKTLSQMSPYCDTSRLLQRIQLAFREWRIIWREFRCEIRCNPIRLLCRLQFPAWSQDRAR